MVRNRLTRSPVLAALCCVAVFLLCVLLIRPTLESGLTDDWSTVRTAQLLAQTGHIVYNGWEAALLGWPLYVAALFVHTFGASFTSIRASNLLEAVLTLLLLHRTLLRAGVNTWNATFVTLTIALTPIYLLASVLFMTDVPGMLAFLVCVYACLRALQAASEDAAAAWISFAALSNAVLGTSRQVAWLGALVMVPCALWLLRRSRRVLLAGVVACLLSWAFIAWCMHWFAQQDYILHASLMPSRRLLSIHKELDITLRTVLDLVLFLLPVAFSFFPAALRPSRRAWVVVVLVAAGLGGGAVVLAHKHHLHHWLSPFLLFPYVHPQTVENTFTMTTMPPKGPAPAPLPHTPRVMVSLAAVCGLLMLLFGLLGRPRVRRDVSRPMRLGWGPLLWLILPTILIYLGFLISRGTYNFVYDRYLLPILPLVLLLLALWYQEREAERLPLLAGVLILLSGAYSVATLHDVFATYRASLQAADEVLAAGYGRQDVDAGWEYNHYTQILVGGYVHQVGVRLPNGKLLENLDADRRTPCSMDVSQWTPDLHPKFAIAYPGTSCQIVPRFAPVSFHTWLAPRQREIRIVQYNDTDNVGPQPAEF